MKPSHLDALLRATADVPSESGVVIDTVINRLPRQTSARVPPQRLLAISIAIALAVITGCMLAVEHLPERPPVLHLYKTKAASPAFLR